MDLLSLLAALFLLAYPSVALLVRGGASALAIVAALVSLVVLLARRGKPEHDSHMFDRPAVQLSIALASPLLAVLVGSAWHLSLLPSTLDSPSRFLAAVPLFLVLRSRCPRLLPYGEYSYAFGALSALGIVLLIPRDWGLGRIGTPFLNPIHFGDIALVLGILSALSLNWWRRDTVATRIVKLSGLLGGVFASLQSGSRGGWIAIPIVAVLILYLRSRHKAFRWNIALPLAIVVGVGALYGFSPVARERVDMVASDFKAYRAGQKDTPVGIRLQLYEAALTLVARRPLLGLGGEGFRDSMRALEEDRQLTPLAAQLGRGETHNQLLAYTVDYGLIGGLALMAIYIVPGIVFYRALQSGDQPVRRAGLMGLAFVVSFWVFGLTVETFDLKSTVSLYATVVAILAATATRIRPTVGAGVSPL